jgi:hypothetical protein
MSEESKLRETQGFWELKELEPMIEDVVILSKDEYA